jgi:hypothetical protein
LNTWQDKLLDIGAYDWKGFNKVFDDFWDVEMASVFLTTRKALGTSVKGLSSQQRVISLDLLTTGLSCGIWNDEVEAVGCLEELVYLCDCITAYTDKTKEDFAYIREFLLNKSSKFPLFADYFSVMLEAMQFGNLLSLKLLDAIEPSDKRARVRASIKYNQKHVKVLLEILQDVVAAIKAEDE